MKSNISSLPKNACPPDSCGGIQLYNALVLTLNDKTHPEHKDNVAWFCNKFKLNKFDVKKVKFKNANTRLKQVRDDIEMWLD